MNWIKKKVFVTGAGGFIGSHLCEALINKGADVTAMIRYTSRSDWGNLEFLSEKHKNELNVVAGNIEDSNFVARQIKGKDIVFHLAALITIPYSYIAPLSYVRTNIEGTLNVLESARNFNVEKVIHTSTSETYGTAIYTPIDEKHPLQGQSPYAASKIGADKIAESYHRSFNLPVAVIRPFNTYGPRQSARAVIPSIISQALSKKTIYLGLLGPKRDLTYVKDTVDGFLKIAESEKSIGEVINIGNGMEFTVGDVANKIIRLLGEKVRIVSENKRIRPNTSEVERLLADNRKAKRLIGWTPRTSLEDGLKETIEWVKANIDSFKTGIYNI